MVESLSSVRTPTPIPSVQDPAPGKPPVQRNLSIVKEEGTIDAEVAAAAVAAESKEETNQTNPRVPKNKIPPSQYHQGLASPAKKFKFDEPTPPQKLGGQPDSNATHGSIASLHPKIELKRAEAKRQPDVVESRLETHKKCIAEFAADAANPAKDQFWVHSQFVLAKDAAKAEIAQDPAIAQVFKEAEALFPVVNAHKMLSAYYEKLKKHLNDSDMDILSVNQHWNAFKEEFHNLWGNQERVQSHPAILTILRKCEEELNAKITDPLRALSSSPEIREAFIQANPKIENSIGFCQMVDVFDEDESLVYAIIINKRYLREDAPQKLDLSMDAEASIVAGLTYLEPMENLQAFKDFLSIDDAEKERLIEEYGASIDIDKLPRANFYAKVYEEQTALIKKKFREFIQSDAFAALKAAPGL